MSDYKQIVWLASYPKSGNTWLRTFLDAYYLGEVDINDLVCSVNDNFATRHLTGNGGDPTLLPVDIQHLTRGMGLLRLVQQFQANQFADMPLFAKTHNAHLVANGIELLPHALTKAVIHIVRDPRNVLPSFAKHMGLDYDAAIEKMDNRVCVLSTPGKVSMADFVSDWGQHTRSFLQADTHNVKTFKYEDMKAYPVETFSAMLEHAGVTPVRARVERALEAVEISKLAKQEADKGFNEASPKNDDRFFGGKHEPITPKQRHLIEKRYGKLMKRLGYTDSKVRAA